MIRTVFLIHRTLLSFAAWTENDQEAVDKAPTAATTLHYPNQRQVLEKLPLVSYLFLPSQSASNLL
jgi:hypothetical protein